VSLGVSRYLVIGADSLIGAELISLLEKSEAGVTTGTTRRLNEADGRTRLFLDIEGDDAMAFCPPGYSVAIFCAAITGIKICEEHPGYTQQINVLNTIALAKGLLAKGTRIVYLSSNAVFDGTSTWPSEDASPSPVCEYGRQKLTVEKQLLSLSTPATPVAIVRLSKVLTAHSGIAAEFLSHLAAGEACAAFDDLRICPISLDYASAAILSVAKAGTAGIFHVSGEDEMSYADFARNLAIHIGANPELVKSATSESVMANLIFRPLHPGLGMYRTSKLLGFGPETKAKLMYSLKPLRPQ
jgi:dTDP-4-dehydrorhamnose reductase